jgi:hypothetical protein
MKGTKREIANLEASHLMKGALCIIQYDSFACLWTLLFQILYLGSKSNSQLDFVKLGMEKKTIYERKKSLFDKILKQHLQVANLDMRFTYICGLALAMGGGGEGFSFGQ